MRKHIISKLVILLITNLTLFTACKKEKVFDVDDLVHRVFNGEDISFFEDALDFRVGEDEKNQQAWDITFPEKKYFFGSTSLGKHFVNHQVTYLWFYEDEADFSKGMLILMLDCHRIIKGKGQKKTIKDSYFLRDYKFIPGFSKNFTTFSSVNYGEPIYTRGGHKLYQSDENICGIYAYEGKYPPYFKEVKPKYLVYVENGKLVVEEPKDDKYFIYRIPEL